MSLTPPKKILHFSHVLPDFNSTAIPTHKWQYTVPLYLEKVNMIHTCIARELCPFQHLTPTAVTKEVESIIQCSAHFPFAQ